MARVHGHLPRSSGSASIEVKGVCIPSSLSAYGARVMAYGKGGVRLRSTGWNLNGNESSDWFEGKTSQLKKIKIETRSFLARLYGGVHVEPTSQG